MNTALATISPVTINGVLAASPGALRSATATVVTPRFTRELIEHPSHGPDYAFLDLAYHALINDNQAMPFLHGYERNAAVRRVHEWISHKAQNMRVATVMQETADGSLLRENAIDFSRPHTLLVSAYNETGKALLLRASSFGEQRVKLDYRQRTVMAQRPTVKAGFIGDDQVIIKMSSIPLLEEPRVVRMTRRNFELLYKPVT